MRRLAVVLVVVATAAGAGAAASVAAADPPDFQWNGLGGGGDWSIGDNWDEVSGPQANSTVGTIVFPSLRVTCAGCGGTDCPPCEEEYESNNDVPGVTATAIQMSLDDVDDAFPDADQPGYQLTGDGIALGSGGFTATATAADDPSAGVQLPITLVAPQTWTITGSGGLTDSGGINGSYPLNVDLGGGGGLGIVSDVETGAITISGLDPSQSGVNAPNNGHVGLQATAGALNATDENALTMTDTELSVGVAASIGPLTVNGGLIRLADGAALTVNGSLALDSATALQLDIVDGSLSPPFLSATQVNTTGNVSLGDAQLSLNSEEDSECEPFPQSASVALISAGGTITGELADASGNPIPNGGVVTLPCMGAADAEPTVTIAYGPHAVTASIDYPGLPVPSPVITSPPTAPAPLPGAVTPLPQPLPVTLEQTTALAGAWHVRGGNSATTTVSCTGATGSSCKIGVKLTVRETRRKGRLLGVTASTRSAPTTRTVVIGSANASVEAGESQTVAVGLNAAGRSLLATQHVLTARVAVTSDGATLSNSNVTFRHKQPPPSRRGGPKGRGR
jgi:hypothetical protein